MDISTLEKNIGPLPEKWQTMMKHSAPLIAKIKTHDQPIYETVIEEDKNQGQSEPSIVPATDDTLFPVDTLM